MLAGIRPWRKRFVGSDQRGLLILILLANYMNPDLVPPQLFAFIFWLRPCLFEVDAFVHVGKHGNLEWFTGAKAALSESLLARYCACLCRIFSVYRQ